MSNNRSVGTYLGYLHLVPLLSGWGIKIFLLVAVWQLASGLVLVINPSPLDSGTYLPTTGLYCNHPISSGTRR